MKRLNYYVINSSPTNITSSRCQILDYLEELTVREHELSSHLATLFNAKLQFYKAFYKAPFTMASKSKYD